MNAYSRKLIAVYMDWLVHVSDRIGYNQLRPMTTRNIEGAVDLHNAIRAGGFGMDCSESVTLLCHLGGLKPPSGDEDGYAYGNTSTLLASLPRLDHASDLETGDLAVFNADRSLVEQHVAACRVPGADPKMFNHGSVEDPRFLKLSQIQPGFTGHTAYLSIGRL